MSIHVMSVKFAGDPHHEPGIDTIAIADGTLLIDDCIVDCEIRDGAWNWIRTRADGNREFGSMKIYMDHGMCMGRGAVLFNDRTIGFSAAGMLEYDMTIVLPDGSVPWYGLVMGFVEKDKGVFVPTARLVSDKEPKIQDFSNVILGTERGACLEMRDEECTSRAPDHLTAGIAIKADYCDLYDAYRGADIKFSLDYQSFSGTVYEYSETGKDYRGKPHELLGKFRSSSLLTRIRGIVQDMPVRLEGARQFGGHNASDADFLVAAGLQSSHTLSVLELYTLPTPDMSALHQFSFDKLRTLMLYAIDDPTRRLFGEVKPVVGGAVLQTSDVDLLNSDDVRNFLVNDFSTGYLTEAYSKTDTKAIRDDFDKIPDHDDKMSYFWSGDGDTSFSKSKGYNLAMSRIMDNTFAEFVPGLKPYRLREGENKPEYWAKQLYDYCTQEPVLTGLSLQTTLDQQGKLTQLSSILHALDPKPRLNAEGMEEGTPPISYATALHERVVNRQLSHVIENFSPGDQDDYVGFLTDYFRLQFASLLADSSWQGKVNGLAREDLQQLMKEYNVTETNRLVDELAPVIAESVEILVSLRAKPIKVRLNKWANSPTKLKISKALHGSMVMGLYAFAILTTVNAFMNWDKLKPEEKAVVLTDVAAVTANMFSDVTVWYAAKVITSAEAEKTQILEQGAKIADAADLQRATGVCNRAAVELNVELREVGAPGLAGGGAAAADGIRLEQLEASSAKWAKFATIGEGVGRMMSVVAMGAACVATGFQVAHDFATGAPTAVKVFDILGTAANGIAFLCEVGAPIAAALNISASMIPLVGVVAAITGVVAAIVSIFLHKKPISPAQQFVREKSTPFIARLAMPGGEWVTTQRQKDARMGS